MRPTISIPTPLAILAPVVAMGLGFMLGHTGGDPEDSDAYGLVQRQLTDTSNDLHGAEARLETAEAEVAVYTRKDAQRETRQAVRAAKLERQRARAREQRCRERAAARNDGAYVMQCAGDEEVVCEDTGSYETTSERGTMTVICEGSAFVGLAYDSDRGVAFARVRHAGRWIGRSAKPGDGIRLQDPTYVPPPPPPPPAPVYNPPAPSGSSSGNDSRYSTDNDHGYTGPRCYQPGGYYFTPC